MNNIFRDLETGAVLELSIIYSQEKLDRKSVRSLKERMRLCLFMVSQKTTRPLLCSAICFKIMTRYTCVFCHVYLQSFCSLGSFSKYVSIFFLHTLNKHTYFVAHKKRPCVTHKHMHMGSKQVVM